MSRTKCPKQSFQKNVIQHNVSSDCNPNFQQKVSNTKNSIELNIRHSWMSGLAPLCTDANRFSKQEWVPSPVSRVASRTWFCLDKYLGNFPNSGNAISFLLNEINWCSMSNISFPSLFYKWLIQILQCLSSHNVFDLKRGSPDLPPVGFLVQNWNFSPLTVLTRSIQVMIP